MAIIFLVGFMGSGKTSVGHQLAAYLQYNFIDLDDLIIKETNLSINDIFSQYGESYFRQIEHKMLNIVTSYQNTVVSLGGGAYISEQNRQLIKKHGLSVWLQCDLTVILSRLANDSSRPLHRSPQQMQELLESRLFAYKQTDFQIDVTNLTIQDAAKQIEKLFR